jgi:stage V sporulation protein K
MMTASPIPDDKTIGYHFQEGKKSFDKGQYASAESSFEHTKRLLRCRLQAPLDPEQREKTKQAVVNMDGWIDACRKGTPMPALPAMPQKMALHSTGDSTTSHPSPGVQGGIASPLMSGPGLTREQALVEFTRQMDDLIGLKEFKQELRTFMNVIAMKMLLGGTKPSCHLVLTGNPGTGKTTVAKLLGDYLYGIGYLAKGHMVEGDEAKLCGTHVGEAQVNTAQAFDQARGGVLFIDEAYTLARGGDNSFGQKVIDVMTHRLDQDRGEMIVIAAGYEKEMQEFLEKNPGLKGKFTRTINFPDYSAAELVAISRRFLGQNRVTAEPEFFAKAHVLCSLKTMFPNRMNANARFVREGIVEQSFGPMADRIMPTNPSPADDSWKVVHANDLLFDKLTGIPWSQVDPDQLEWELTRENGDVIQMDADTVGQYFANMTDHRVLDEGQPELTPASKQYLAELVETVN